MADNVIPIRKNFALFNDQVRKSMADSLVGSVPPNTEDKTVDRLEEVLCAEIMRFLRTVFVGLASKAGESLGKKISGN